MWKLVIVILAVFGTGVALLQLRQQRLLYRHEINRLHDRMSEQQVGLWEQQVRIAVATGPEALTTRVRGMERSGMGQDEPGVKESSRWLQPRLSPEGREAGTPPARETR
jgi:hypothetical protein